MSKIGRRPIPIPPEIQIKIEPHDIHISGPKGELNLSYKNVFIEQLDSNVYVRAAGPSREASMFQGLYRSLINNMILGLTKGFSRSLQIKGVGYKALIESDKLILHIGFSHLVNIQIPKGLSVVINRNIIEVSGVDKQQVGQFAATLRAQKPPEPYKGTGIRYENEVIKRKAGKIAKAASSS